MKFTLPSGLEVNLGIKHTSDETLRDYPESFFDHFRGTHVWLKFVIGTGDEQKVEVRSICKPPDVFCRRTGRRLAGNRLLAELRKMRHFEWDSAVHLPIVKEFNKQDRRAIFARICPEYVRVGKLVK